MSEEISARLDALETVVAVLARRDPGIQQAVLMALKAAREDVVAELNKPEETGFARPVRLVHRPTPNTSAMRAQVCAYEALIRKVDRA